MNTPASTASAYRDALLNRCVQAQDARPLSANTRALSRFAALEKARGRAGNVAGAVRAANQLARACRFYSFTNNPFA